MDYKSNASIVILLFGSIRYDGRVKRDISVFKKLGETTLIDINSEKTAKNKADGLNTVSLKIPKIFKSLLAHFYYWIKSILISSRLNLKVVVSEDYFTILPGLIISKLKKSLLVYNSHELIIIDKDEKSNLREQFWFFIEKILIDKVDLVICANKERAQIMYDYYKLSKMPLVINNIPDIHEVDRKVNVLKKYPVLEGIRKTDKLIIYQGVISLTRGLTRFILTLDYLPDNYKFIMVGGITDKNEFKKLTDKYIKNKKMLLVGKVDNQDLPLISSIADVGVVSYPFKGKNNINCASNKIHEYLQSGIPVITTDQPPLKSDIKAYNIGKTVSEDESSELVSQKIIDMVNNKQLFTRNIPNFLKNYSWKNEDKKLVQALENLITK